VTIDKHKKNEILEMIAHLCVGLSIFMKGIDKLGHHGKELAGIFFLAASLAILAGTIFHKKYEQKLGSLKYLVFISESLVMAILGYVQMMDGTHLLHYFSFGVSALFVIPIVLLWRQNKKKREQEAKPEKVKFVGEANSIASQEEKF
jgi:hypothetical protein